MNHIAIRLRDALFSLLKENGACLMGVADLSGIVTGTMQMGVCVAVALEKHIVRDLQNAPTREYCEAYHTVNAKLNDIVSCGAIFLQKQGYQAFANTTAVIKADEHSITPLPHKTVATLAGLGWIGKNCLFVTNEYGSAIRLSTLLTNAPLPIGQPILESKCGECRACVECCPAHALSGALWKAGMPRADILDWQACSQTMAKRTKEATGIDAAVCGRCFAVCPYTKKYLEG